MLNAECPYFSVVLNTRYMLDMLNTRYVTDTCSLLCPKPITLEGAIDLMSCRTRRKK